MTKLNDRYYVEYNMGETKIDEILDLCERVDYEGLIVDGDSEAIYIPTKFKD